MPIINISGYNNVVIPVDNYNHFSWINTSKKIVDEFGFDTVTDPIKFQNILKRALTYIEDDFNQELLKHKKFSFYLFVQNFHENSCEIFFKQCNGLDLRELTSQFALTRRLLKIVLEQACAIEYENCPNFSEDYYENRFIYLETLENLMAIAKYGFEITDSIARSQMFPRSMGLVIKNSILEVQEFRPFIEINSFVWNDMSKHNADVVIQQNFDELKTLIDKATNNNFDVINQYVYHKESEIKNRNGVYPCQEFLEYFQSQNEIENENCKLIFAGLTLTKENKLSFIDSFIRGQDIDRILYKCLIKVYIDGNEFYVVGKGKWLECFYSLTHNAIPYNIFPIEWSKITIISGHIKNKIKNNDKLLEDRIENILKNNEIPFERNIKTFEYERNKYINLLKNGVGEIDYIFINSVNNTLYICECKNNRIRFDSCGWRRDYSKFEDDYENQLGRKLSWAMDNVEIIVKHFARKFERIPNWRDLKVEGVFLINAPTLYMYDSPFVTLTLYNLKNLIENKLKFEIIHVTDIYNNKFDLCLPYFKNANKRIDQILE